jgi:hypothetical protein
MKRLWQRFLSFLWSLFCLLLGLVFIVLVVWGTLDRAGRDAYDDDGPSGPFTARDLR